MYLPYMDPIGYHLFNGTLLVSPQLPQPEASQVLPIGLVAQSPKHKRMNWLTCFKRFGFVFVGDFLWIVPFFG